MSKVEGSKGIIAIIPARMGSSRFPGKPLARILGEPMIKHVHDQTKQCEQFDEVYVATCDEEIRAVVEGFGGQVVMTSPAHDRATDRVAEAAELISDDASIDIVVMVQGDEPMITPAMLETSIRPMLLDPTIECVNLVKRIADVKEYFDPNTIKVVMNSSGDAVYFSRAPIPATDFEKHKEVVVYKQVCVIPFRRAFLRTFSKLPQTPLEKTESIDMLRAIEHGERIRLVETEVETHAVDTLEDLRRVERLMSNLDT